MTDSAPLSEATIFPGLRQFYAESGVQAWAQTVPLHATSNPFLADSYATVIVRFIQEAIATGEVERDQPFYVAELGSGSGKFGFHLVKRLRELRQTLGLEHLRIVTVMSDVADANIEYWTNHPRLRAFVERGELLLARFDVAADHGFHLVSPDPDAGELTTFANPLVVVANYLFDSLPQDLFRLSDGHLDEMLATLVASETEGASDLGWTPRPVDFPRYHDPEFDRILDEARPQSGCDALMFPVTALRALRRLADAAQGRLCLLAADLGAGGKLVAAPELRIGTEAGFFYLPVDFSVIGQFFAGLGPGVHRHWPASTLDTFLAVSGFQPEQLRETCHAFSSSLETFGTRGRTAMTSLLEHGGQYLAPEEWLPLASLGRYDSLFLHASTETISRWIREDLLRPPLKLELVGVLRRFGAEIYWTPGAPDAYFDLATVLHELGELKAAIASYLLSLETVGPSVETYIYLALALRLLGRGEAAMEALRDALAVDPSHVVARGWLGRMELELSGQLPGIATPHEAT
jgi:tetratricopeptide (TPR) repeat protein